jgi:hypothetical protein
MVIAAFLAWPFGWVHVVVTIVGGFFLSFLCMHVFRMWSQMALFLGALSR